jgi:hypothetical protein
MIVDNERHLPGFLAGTHYNGTLAGNHLSGILTENHLHICINVVNIDSVHYLQRRALPTRYGSFRYSQFIARLVGFLDKVHEIDLVLELLQ